MDEKQSYHMPLDDFRRHAHAVVDWLIDYYERVETLPVLAQVAPGDVRAKLPAEPPQHGEPFAAMLRDVEQIILPGITHWQSPHFYAFFPANGSPPAILGDLLSTGLGVQGMLWATSPACTELETHVLDWLVGMLALPAKFLSSGDGGGVIEDSASSATLCALLAARERASDFAIRRAGGTGRLVAYASTQAHSSIVKAAIIAGIGEENVRLIAVDEHFAMRPDALAAQIAADEAAGLQPFFLSANIGSTSSAAIDPLAALGPLCRAHGIWLHADAAMYGTAALCPEFQPLLNGGLEYADSYTFNPHKWMFTNFDCNCFYVADRRALIGALSVLPEYLRNAASASGAVIDYRDWQIPLGRRFRALKLWFVIRHYGVEGLQHHIRRHVELTQQLCAHIVGDDRFEIVAPVDFNLICFRYRGADEFNEALLTRLNAGGRLYLTQTRLNGRYVIRLCVGQTHTEARHVAAAWDEIRRVTAELEVGAGFKPAPTRPEWEG